MKTIRLMTLLASLILLAAPGTHAAQAAQPGEK